LIGQRKTEEGGKKKNRKPGIEKDSSTRSGRESGKHGGQKRKRVRKGKDGRFNRKEKKWGTSSGFQGRLENFGR